MTAARLLLVVLMTGLCAACGQGAALDGLADAGAEVVAGAVDGDTLTTHSGREVRLAGIVAPALDAPYGPEARDALAGLANSRQVRLLSGGAGDGFQVRDAKSRAWLQKTLLAQGAARVRTLPGEQALAKEMLGAEAAARVANRGLWALPDYQVRLPREVVEGKLIGFQIVEGRVLAVSETAGRVYMEFNRPWRGGFSTETPYAQARDFASAGVDPRDLRGTLIRVRGPVRATRYGPRLMLTHPEQIERLRDSGPERR